MNKIFLILLASFVKASSLWQYFFSSPTGPAPKNNNNRGSSETLRKKLYEYEKKYFSIPFNNANRKSLIRSEKQMDDVAFAIRCSMTNVGDSGSDCPEERFFMHNEYVKVIKSSNLLIVAFSPVINVHCGDGEEIAYWKHVLDIYHRAEKIFGKLEKEISECKKVVFTGRGSGGSIASLIAWKFGDFGRKMMIVTLDELPVYSHNMRVHPIGSKAYIRFTSDILYQKFAETGDFYWPKETKVIDLWFVGIYDDNFGKSFDGFNLENYLPNHQIRTEGERQTLKNKIIKDIKQATSACKLIPQAYNKYKSTQEISEITRLVEKHIKDKLKINVICQLNEKKISCQEKESSILLFEFLFKLSKTGRESEICKRLIKEAETLSSSRDLPKNIRNCFHSLFDQRNGALKYFREEKNSMCHIAENSSKILYLLPISGLEKLYLLYQNAPLTFFSMTSYKYINFPSKECQEILEPIISTWDKTIIELRKLASSFLFNPSSFVVSNSFNNNDTFDYPEIADCLSMINSFPALDCSLKINHWMGYCPEICENKNSTLFCRNLIICPNNFYLSVSPTSFLYDNFMTIQALHQSLANKSRISYWLYEITSLYKRYSWIYSQFYLLVLRE